MGGVPLPEGYHSVNPYIVVDDAERLIDFLVQVFGAVEQGHSLRPDGRIDHADVRIGDSLVMLSEAALLHPAVPQPDGSLVNELLTGHQSGRLASTSVRLKPRERISRHVRAGCGKPTRVHRWWPACGRRPDTRPGLRSSQTAAWP